MFDDETVKTIKIVVHDLFIGFVFMVLTYQLLSVLFQFDIYASELQIVTSRPVWVYLMDGSSDWWQITHYYPGQHIAVRDGVYTVGISDAFNPSEPEGPTYASGTINEYEEVVIQCPK